MSVIRFDLRHGRNFAPKIECISCAKPFNLGNLSLLTNFQNLCTVKSNATNVAHFYKDVILVLTNTYCNIHTLKFYHNLGF